MATTTLTVRMSEELYNIVVKEAKSQKMTPAEYARGNIAAGLLFDGNTEVLKLAGKQLGVMLMEKIRAACAVEGYSGITVQSVGNLAMAVDAEPAQRGIAEPKAKWKTGGKK